MKDNIVLIGFMGSGKSSIGIRLAHALNYEFMDTDQYIETSCGKSIKDIFATEGEEAFRRIETNCLKELSQTLHHNVIATGGGMPLREENAALLHEIGMVIFLDTSQEEIYNRLKEDTTRPLLAGDNPMQKIETLLKARLPLYQKAADLVITTDGRSYYSMIEEIEKLIIK